MRRQIHRTRDAATPVEIRLAVDGYRFLVASVSADGVPADAAARFFTPEGPVREVDVPNWPDDEYFVLPLVGEELVTQVRCGAGTESMVIQGAVRGR